MAVDILPTALPLEASQHFSKAFLPYLRSVLAGYSFSDVQGKESGRTREAEALDRATVASGGELRQGWEWLRGPLGVWKDGPEASASSDTVSGTVDAAKKSTSTGMHPRKVLMLGSGMVTPPAIKELCRRPDVQLVVGQFVRRFCEYVHILTDGVASNVLQDAKRLTAPYENATPVLVDVSDPVAVERLVAGSDVVVRCE